MNLLWVTSFAADMYEASGKAMIDTFWASRSDGRLLVCAEGVDLQLEANRSNILTYKLDDDEWLKSWLEENRPFIPEHLGGTAPACKCDKGKSLDPHSKKHVMPCVGHWFNRNASRWFRKIVCLKRALLYNPDVIIWVDSDCRFRKRVQEIEVANWFGIKSGVFYHKSRRRVIEAGIIGYFLSRGGKKIISKVIDCYRTGAYRNLTRWDDSYVIQKMIDKNRDVATVDLAKKAGNHSDVVQYSPVGVFIEHEKGKHGRKLGIMK